MILKTHIDNLYLDNAIKIKSAGLWHAGTMNLVHDYHSNQKAISIFDQVTKYILEILTKLQVSGHKGYYLMDTNEGYLVIFGNAKYKGMVLFDREETSLGYAISITIPQFYQIINNDELMSESPILIMKDHTELIPKSKSKIDNQLKAKKAVKPFASTFKSIKLNFLT